MTVMSLSQAMILNITGLYLVTSVLCVNWSLSVALSLRLYFKYFGYYVSLHDIIGQIPQKSLHLSSCIYAILITPQSHCTCIHVLVYTKFMITYSAKR